MPDTMVGVTKFRPCAHACDAAGMSDNAYVLCRGLCTISPTSGVSNKEIRSAALQDLLHGRNFHDDPEEGKPGHTAST